MAEVSNYDHQNVDNASLWDQFERWVQSDASAVAIFYDELPVARKELHDRARRVSRQLAQAGVEASQRVLFDAYTVVDTAVIGLAVSKLGATICPINPILGTHERQTIIERLGPVAVIDRVDTQNAVSLETPDTPLFINMRLPNAVIEQEMPRGTAAIIGFTSGTTGVPKAVPHTAAALNYTARVTAGIAGLQSGEPIMAISPLSSAPGWAFYIHMGLTLGSPLVLAEKWDAYRVLDLMMKHQVAWGMCVPTHLHMMLDLAISGEWNGHLTSMRALAVGGSPNTETMVKNAEEYLALKVLRMFGMSECLGHASILLNDPPERHLTYDGVPYPGTHLEAYDEDGKILPRGKVGQAGVRGPSLFLGYLPGLGGDQDCFTPDGAFLTGDRIVRDAEGYVKVVGRIKDQIIRGGLNIDVSEVEQALASHPAVTEAVLVGRPDDRLGERLCAVIVPSDSPGPTLEELCDHVQALGLAKYKSPEFLILVEELPTTHFGKLDKKKMKKMAEKAQPQGNG